VRVPAVGEGEGNRAVSALYGREAVEDCEMRIAGGAVRGELDPVIERLGLELQIATRLTSWVAVTEEATVDATAPVRRERMPHELPHGMSIEGLGLRAAHPALPLGIDDYDECIDDEGVFRDLGGATFDRAAVPKRRFGLGRHGAAGEPRRGSFDDLAERFRAIEERALRGLGRKRRDTRSSREPDGSAGAPEPTRRRLRGRRLVSTRRKLVLEAEVAGALAWSAGDEVEIVLTDGRRLRATVVPAATTRAGTIADGLVVRLALELPDDVAADVVAVELGSGLVIEVV